jgi:hypothetical protein
LLQNLAKIHQILAIFHLSTYLHNQTTIIDLRCRNFWILLNLTLVDKSAD